MDIFKKGTKLNLRFSSVRGNVSIEDLWVIPMNSGDGFNMEQIAQTAHSELEKLGVKSFTGKSSGKTDVAELRMEIIKEVIADRIAEADAKIDAIKNKQRVAKLEAILMSRKEQADEEMSTEDIEKELEALRA